MSTQITGRPLPLLDAFVKNTSVTKKSTSLQLRVSEDIKDDLQQLAEWRGLSVSALIHSTLVRTIREAKENEPHAFRPPMANVEERPKNVMPGGTITFKAEKDKDKAVNE